MQIVPNNVDVYVSLTKFVGNMGYNLL